MVPEGFRYRVYQVKIAGDYKNFQTVILSLTLLPSASYTMTSLIPFDRTTIRLNNQRGAFPG